MPKKKVIVSQKKATRQDGTLKKGFKWVKGGNGKAVHVSATKKGRKK